MTAAIGGAGGMLDVAAGVGVGIAGAAGARVPAMIRCLDPLNLGLVLFDFNPKEIKVDRTSSTTNLSSMGSSGRPSGASGSVTRKVAGSKISMQNVIFEGMTTKLRCDTLLTWMSPGSGFLAQFVSAITGSNLAIDPPDLTFQWGPPMIGFMYTVKLTSCSVTYERFDSTGIPLRAKLNLTMQEQPSLLGSLPTNPTSGGLPGRRSHVLAHGESLASIANQYYGRPGMWRSIAAVNGIDDPHRVKPGTTVYLPNVDELDGGTR